MPSDILAALAVVGEGRPSLRFIVLATVALSVVAMLMALYLIVLRAWLHYRARWRAERAKVYQPAIEMTLMEEPHAKVLEALRPRRPLDADVVQEVMTESMNHLQGAPFEELRVCAVELGFIAANLRALASYDPHRRGTAMERLGLMRAKEAVGPITATLLGESLELKLVGLRALAAIGDERSLDSFLAVAEKVPAGLLPRLASLMLEFGAPGRDAVRELLNRRSKDFPPASVPDLLQELAQDWGAM